jgi:hypothetical protein
MEEHALRTRIYALAEIESMDELVLSPAVSNLIRMQRNNTRIPINLLKLTPQLHQFSPLKDTVSGCGCSSVRHKIIGNLGFEIPEKKEERDANRFAREVTRKSW